jgi:hypothetical protein
MDEGVQRALAWSGPLLMAVFLGGFLIAGFIPPPAPNLSAADVAQIFINHQNRIRAGMVLCSFAGPLMFSWSAAIGAQMRRIEGSFSALAWVQMLAGGTTAILFYVPTILLEVAAFRPRSRAPELTLLLDDIAWLMFLAATSFALFQGMAIAIAIFRDNKKPPVFPRWVGYFNVWIAVLFQPASATVFFLHGPLAWSGILVWWMPATIFGVWFVVMLVMLLRAINQQEQDHISGESAVNAQVSRGTVGG